MAIDLHVRNLIESTNSWINVVYNLMFCQEDFPAILVLSSLSYSFHKSAFAHKEVLLIVNRLFNTPVKVVRIRYNFRSDILLMYVKGEHFVVVKTVCPRVENIKGSQIVSLVHNTN